MVFEFMRFNIDGSCYCSILNFKRIPYDITLYATRRYVPLNVRAHEVVTSRDGGFGSI
jgi:hypothetical protein